MSLIEFIDIYSPLSQRNNRVNTLFPAIFLLAFNLLHLLLIMFRWFHVERWNCFCDPEIKSRITPAFNL